MANQNNKPRKVSRQNWKPNFAFNLASGAWTAIYSVIKVVLGALATVVVIGGVCLMVFIMALGDYLQNDILPNSEVTLEGFDLGQNSNTYYVDEEGNIQVLQKLYAETISEWATYDEIPDAMKYATVAIEDKRFFEHQGVDWFTTIKACANMFFGDGDFGGSSITQQLIKNMYEADDVTVQRKIQEIFRATALEKRYDKEVILTYYLNYIYLGNRVNGVKAAAAYYFGKELELLTPAECACLISITNNPSIFDPTRDEMIKYDGEVKTGFEHNHTRKENTLWMMRNEGYLTEDEYQEALAQELVFKQGIDFEDKLADCPNEECGYHNTIGTFELREDGEYYCPSCGSITTIGEDASQEVYSWFVDTVLEDVAIAFAERDGLDWSKFTKDQRNMYKQLVCGGGYHIYTTLDMKVQNQVDKIYKDLSQIPTAKSVQQLQSAMIVIDNHTGDIVAMAGGVGDDKGFDDYNRAVDAKLQPGSSMKPLSVYAPAFEMGIFSPASVVNDLPLYYMGDKDKGNYRPFPYNDGRDYSFGRTIKSGLVSSINAIAVNTLDTIGLTYSYNFAKNQFGLSDLTNHYVNSAGDILSDEGYSPLGMGAPTVGVSVKDMAAGFATFASEGVHREARTYTKVYNSKGELVLDNTQDAEQIISEKTTDYINYCLDQAVDYGTGWNADLESIGIDVCGKTGTTSSMKDRWFCGYTQYYTAAVWCGYDIPEVINLTGDRSNPAGRLWKKVMEPLHKGKSSEKLYNEDNFVQINVCTGCGKLATASCSLDPRTKDTGESVVETVMVYPEDMPLDDCTCHVKVKWCNECNAVANEYCKKLASLGMCTLSERALVKMTQSMVDDLAEASNYGLYSRHFKDNYVYLVDDSGRAAAFHGFKGDKNVDVSAPYLLCDIHTKEMWQDAQKPGQSEDPEDPDEPEDPVDPSVPEFDFPMFPDNPLLPGG